MVKKIISGGQTGADRAALDAAIELDIPHGGWIPKGRKTKDGSLPPRYQLKEMPTDSYPECTERNVIDSDGTLIMSHGDLTGGAAKTLEMAEKHDKSWIHIDLNKRSAFASATLVSAWIIKYDIGVLNVAGSRASKDPDIYKATLRFLKVVISLNQITNSYPTEQTAFDKWPNTLDEAVDRLITELSLKDKTKIAQMEEDTLHLLISLAEYIKERFGLWAGNESLMESCRFLSKKYGIHYELREDDASALIIKELWNTLRKTHGLRVVK